jgi:hypothetical protein
MWERDREEKIIMHPPKPNSKASANITRGLNVVKDQNYSLQSGKKTNASKTEWKRKRSRNPWNKLIARLASATILACLVERIRSKEAV